MNSKGFTLIELLVVTAIFTLILTGLTIALMQQQRQSNVTEEAIDVDQTGRTALDYISSTIRNATARQGKTFSLRFFNGGSTANPRCSASTGDPNGSTNNTPDCLSIFTWDITRGQNGSSLPSTAEGVTIVSAGPPLVLQLPSGWFVGNKLIGETSNPVNNILLGFRSRINSCNPDPSVNCVTNPNLCTECAAILRSTINGTTKQATIEDDVNEIIEQNFQQDGFDDMTTFLNNFFRSLSRTA